MIGILLMFLSVAAAMMILAGLGELAERLPDRFWEKLDKAIFGPWEPRPPKVRRPLQVHMGIHVLPEPAIRAVVHGERRDEA